jgi:hypothetical protein
MKQLVVPNTGAMCAVLHNSVFMVKKVAGSGSKGVVIGILQTADDKPATKEDWDQSEREVRLGVEGRGVSKDVELWQEKSTLKRLEAVRLRGALIDAGGWRLNPKP